ncbi:rhomboid family intramembrane serine protease [Pseudoxanthomonas sp. SGD-10]|nr:rhomboid family intramembrane serine protease [Pseudoxanthomonas sp. SGD-10]
MREFRPLGNTIFPPVVKNLLIINGIMFLATNVFGGSLGIDLNRLLGLYYFESPNFRVWQFFTHLFMHGNMMHIFSNMLALWMFGSVLENYLGSKRFLQYYIITGLGAAFLHLGVQFVEVQMLKEQLSAAAINEVLNNGASVVAQRMNYADPQVAAYTGALFFPTVGASGAVFGLLLAFGMLFPNALIYLYFLLPIKAKYFVIFYGLFELYSGFANNPGDNVAHFAHLGGMLFGYILIKIWRIRKAGDFFM